MNNPGAQGFIPAADPASKTAYVFSDVGQLHTAIADYGFIPLTSAGQPYKVQTVEGGYVLDGAPLNVRMDGVWFEGQREILEPLWANGTIQKPEDFILTSIPTVPMPADVKQAYQAYKAQQSPLSGTTGLMIAAAVGIGALWIFGGGGGKKSPPAYEGFD